MKEIPYLCKYCGAPSWLDPSEQTPPPDYCHPSDHGDPEDFYSEYRAEHDSNNMER